LTVGFAVLHFGDHNLTAGVRPFQSKNAFNVLVAEASQAFSSADLPECLRVIDRHFRGAIYSLKSLFRDEQRRILSQIVDSTMDDVEVMYRQIYEHHAPLMRFLSDLHMPPPPILRATAEFVLSDAVQRAFTHQELDLDRIRTLLDAARHDGVNLNISGLESALRQRLNAAVEQWARKPGDPEALGMVEALVSLSRVPPLEVDLWKPQNVYYQLVEALSGANQMRVSGAWLDHFRGLGEWLGVAAPQRSGELPYRPRDQIA